MFTFAQKQKPAQRTNSMNFTRHGKAYVEQNHALRSILHLQRTIGNQAVQQLLQSNPEGLEVDSSSTEQRGFVHDFSRIPIYPHAQQTAQAKLAINEPGDKYEREADRVADQVMRMPESQHADTYNSERPEHQTEQLSQDLRLLQIKHFERNDAEETVVPPNVHEVLRSTGQPLEPATHRFMESRFGHNFSQVRVHTGDQAAASAQAVNALAYTVGQHVVFAKNQYSPRTDLGGRLLAHELAHVTQQSLFPGSQLQREATRPRGVTGQSVIKDVETQTAGAKGKVTVGSLAKTEWESLFRRHFTEPDQIEEELESSHSRYFYSRIYGWIDAQHFFAHIQFAEDLGVNKATEKGIDIEKKQKLVRLQIEPDKGLDPAGYWLLFEKPALVTPSDVEHYRDTLMIAFLVAKNMLLSKQEQALTKGFTDLQFAKLLLDSAMSAWSAEDLVSNQLGVQFFQLHGAHINAGKDSVEVRKRFIERLTDFFKAIQVVDNPKAVKQLAKKLPGKERWHAAKMGEAMARKRFPELFNFSAKTHRLRIAIYNTEKRAEQGKKIVAKGVPSAFGLHVAPLGSNRFALYTSEMSHIEAVIFKNLIDQSIKTKAHIEKKP